MVDVIIVGGGPAGSTMGSYLSKAGVSNLIIDSANHPREHVGESLVVSTVAIFDEIGFLETMENSDFPRKEGASWHAPAGKEFAIRFTEFPHYNIHRDYVWHVDRGKFDLMQLKHAEKLGSKVMQGVHAKRVLFDGERACGVRVQVADAEVDLHAKVVVDASGRGTLLGRQLRIKDKDPIFNQYAVHAWFKNVDRSVARTEGYIHIYFLPVERGWVWQIPITDEITSMGVVAEREVFKQAKLDLGDYFHKYVNTNPDLRRAMENAVRVNEFKTEGDYSYKMQHFAGNGYVLVGDAARFVDPIFSSGVSVAMFSAKFASEAIVAALRNGDTSRAAFLPYEEKMLGGVEVWYEFIRLYYKLMPLFTHFVQHKTYRRQIKELLQGVVFDRKNVPVLDAMREYVKKVESTDSHLLRGHLTNISID